MKITMRNYTGILYKPVYLWKTFIDTSMKCETPSPPLSAMLMLANKKPENYDNRRNEEIFELGVRIKKNVIGYTCIFCRGLNVAVVTTYIEFVILSQNT